MEQLERTLETYGRTVFTLACRHEDDKRLLAKHPFRVTRICFWCTKVLRKGKARYCGACLTQGKKVAYCDDKCQRAHWSVIHKKYCNTAFDVAVEKFHEAQQP